MTHVIQADGTSLIAFLGSPFLVKACLESSDNVVGGRARLHFAKGSSKRHEAFVRLIKVFVALEDAGKAFSIGTIVGSTKDCSLYSHPN